MKNPARKALLDRTVTFGGWIQCGNAATAEIFARSGFEWIVADCEHSDFDVQAATAVFRGMHGRGPVPLVRVRENDTMAIRQVLDAGASGVIVPLVNTPEAAEQAVRAAKYPPEGIRGFGFSRASNWGIDFDTYAREANDDIAVMVMIETREAAENIENILAVAGVDGVLIGPYDLSGSYGLPSETDHPTVVQACAQVAAACQAAGKSAGLHVVRPTPELVQRVVRHGFTFLALGMDSVFLHEASCAALAMAREAMETQ
jgi:2-keto-3-deoxy-L-rhamnonate aldolase RhmA